MGTRYHINYRTEETRRKGYVPASVFGAADDGAAAAIKALLDAATVGQAVSFMKRVYVTDNVGLPPAGSRYSARCIGVDVNEGSETFHLKNLASDTGTIEEDIAACLMGVAGPVGGAGITALSAPAALVSTGQVIDHVNVGDQLKK